MSEIKPPSSAEVEASSQTSFPLPDQKSRWQRLGRWLRYRLIIPIARGRNSGVPTARGTAIGLFFGLTPTVGIQMPLIMVLWAVAKIVAPGWKFNLIVALAWTWPTNVLTAPLYYYLCLLTGQVFLGQGLAIDFDDFQSQVSAVLSKDAGFFESFWIYAVEIMSTWGVPLFLGCIPWAIFGTWLGYVLTLQFLDRFKSRQRRMMQLRRERRTRKRASQARGLTTQV